jgi:hypothetical protein
MKKTKEQQIVDWLINGEINFIKLLSIYVSYLEENKKQNDYLITELGFISCMYRNPKLNCGSKQQLEERFKKAIKQSKLFKGTVFEKEL